MASQPVAPTAAAPTAAASGAAVVELQAVIPTGQWDQALQDSFNQAYSGKIKMSLESIPYNNLNEKLAGYLASGSPPDLTRAFTGYTKDFYAQGILDPVDDALGKEWVDSLIPALTQPPHGDVINGHIYMGYYSVSLLAIVARRDLLSQVKVDPYSMKTFDDFVAAATKIASDTPVKQPITMVLGTPLAAAETTRWVFTSHGLDNIADFRQEKRPDYIAALNAVLKMAPLIPTAAYTWDYGQSDQAYAEGVTAFYAIGNWYFGGVFKQSPEAVSEARSIPIPYPGGPRFPNQSVKFNANGWYLLKDGRVFSGSTSGGSS